MRFMVLVAAWERQNLSEAIFCAVGVRVVDLVHSSKGTTALLPSE